jgi:class 3 adenylate cyclase/tetratricopeptide (TPR) repeat protein
VTVLFADIAGSMELLGDRDPEEARTVLDAVLERMMEAVHRYEGTVNQVMGDGIMALFGAPIAHEDHAVRACYSALHMQQAVSRYADEIEQSTGRLVKVRIGLNSGEVVVRSIGSDLHMDYTAVGQTTHLAARMEQLSPPGAILITASTRRLAEPVIEVRALGERAVKGLEEPISVYELIGAVPVRSVLRTTVVQPRTPFVGRQADLGRLATIATEAARGHGQFVALSGEPGVGKTRLIYEFVRSPETRAWQVLECRSLSYETNVAWGPVIPLLRRYFELHGREDPAEIEEKVSGRLLALDRRLEDVVAPMLALLGAIPDTHAWGRIDAPERRRLVVDALTRVVLAEAERQPLLLVVEDLQWADSTTRAFIERLVDRLSSARLMLMVDYRPELSHEWEGRPGFTEIVVTPLSRQLTHELVDTLLGGEEDMADLKQLLVERSEGNPFFLEEMVHALIETRRLVQQDGAYRLRSDLALEIPATVQAVLAARIDRLSPPEKLLLQTAAVIGMDVPPALLQMLTDLGPQELDRTLATLVSARFLDATTLYPDVEYRFRHPLIREVATSSLLREQRRRLHVRIVAAIETVYADRLSSWIDRLARHASRAELWPEAAAYNRQAGARAAAHAANVDAVQAYETALDALTRQPSTRETIEEAIDIRLDLLAPLLQLGRLDDLLAVAREAERQARDIGDDQRLARVYTYLVNYHYLRGEATVAIEYGQRCVDVVRQSGDAALEALGRQYIGQSRHLRGEYAAAEDALRRNLVLDPERAPTCYIASCAWLAWTLAERGEFEAAYASLDRGLRAAEQGAHSYGQAIAWAVAGVVAIRRGHLTRAVLPLGRSLELTQRKHLPVWQPIPSSLLGLALVRLGHVTEGLRLLGQGVSLSRRLGVRAYLASWTLNLAEGYLAAGEFERATATAAEARSIAEKDGERGHQAYTHEILGDIALAGRAPDVARALASYDKGLELATELGLRPLAVSLHRRLHRLHASHGGRGVADRHLAAADSLATELGLQRSSAAPEETGRAIGRLLIVARTNTDLYDFLAEELAGAKGLDVIVDRRHHHQDHVADRRRQIDVTEDLRDWQFAIAARQA